MRQHFLGRLLIWFSGFGLVAWGATVSVVIALVLVFGGSPSGQVKSLLREDTPYATPVATRAAAQDNSPTPTAIASEEAQAAKPSPVFEQAGLSGPSVNMFIIHPVQQGVVGESAALPKENIPNFAQLATAPTSATYSISIDFDSAARVPEPLRIPIQTAIAQGRQFLPDIEAWTATAIRQSGDWATIVVVPSYVVATGWEIAYPPEAIVEILAHNSQGQWEAYLLRATDRLQTITSQIPRNFIDLVSPLVANEAYLFPWTKGQEWFKTDPWHFNDAIDFQPVLRNDPNVNFAVLAAASGKLTLLCDLDEQATLQIQHYNGITKYLHLDASTIRRDLLGQNVARGQYLGLLYNGTFGGGGGYRYNGRCGKGTALHLHFEVTPRSAAALIDGYDINQVALSPWATKYTSTNIRIDNGIINTLPTPAPDFAETAEDMPVNIAVLANDTDPEAQALSVTAITQPANGIALLNADNTVTYTPNAGFSGQDTFSYTASDGELTADASVTVNVIPFALQSHDNYSYCSIEPHTDTITITGVGDRQLKGQIIVDYVVGNQRVLIEKYAVDHTGPADFSQAFVLPGVSNDYIFIDPTIGKKVFEVHVDIQIEVVDANGNFVRNADGTVKTFGVNGGDYDAYCIESHLPTLTPEPTVEATPEVTDTAPMPEAPPVELIEESPPATPEETPAVEATDPVQ